ncbi:hypothetical protein AAFF_G00269560 [Aldrovandia affinis]|uniref:Uncharacterized protein n=1 Tax=Aldrovandia affinis TaxID=143900 RepID=A0AAD7SS98_9TELE|nr:hypothetical protein AAFF_G00269560 [Aldrovandia affinis]
MREEQQGKAPLPWRQLRCPQREAGIQHRLWGCQPPSGHGSQRATAAEPGDEPGKNGPLITATPTKQYGRHIIEDPE